MKPTVTWILLADGAQAKVFEHSGPGTGLTPIRVLRGPAHGPKRSGRPGCSRPRARPRPGPQDSGVVRAPTGFWRWRRRVREERANPP